MPNHTELLELLLTNRGIKPKDREKFLNPLYEEHLYDPFLMKDMERAVVRIFESIEAKEKIVIYSDYDCDGIPAAVIMNDFFTKIGYKNFSIYIPDRHDEGYGLHSDAVKQFIDDEVKLLITFDLGITAVNEVAQAQAAGVDIIITDHHLPQETIPRAFAVIDPKQDGCEYPDKMLCGAGLAFKLVQAMLIKYGEYFKISNGWEKWLLDMAGLATLADQVPLVDENRVFAYYGLKVLQKARRPGLAEIFRKAGVDASKLNEEDITFTLAPRLNAASRMGDPMRAFEVLATTNGLEARTLADHLVKLNDERKQTVARIMKDVKKTLSKREDKSIIVIGNPSWRVGILGLVASKIAEEYKRSVFVWGSEGSDLPAQAGIIRGSCRGWGNVNLVDIMNSLPENSLLAFGGHKSAGGFSVSHTEIHFLEERLLTVFDGINNTKEENPLINIDASISIDDLTIDNYNVIERLAPFGIGNPKPTFLFEDLPITSVKEFGKDKNHLELMFTNKYGRPAKAIVFFKNRQSFGRSISAGERINLTATFEKSTFGGRTELRLRIVDII
ncbi:MAG: single-stranded-DNA-specific exonuclease RecJ [Patescibacteria group bacterium]|nr:single-stranded-DNA-specific exonuclease RecJ [Patescibacteria group bacterium]